MRVVKEVSMSERSFVIALAGESRQVKRIETHSESSCTALMISGNSWEEE